MADNFLYVQSQPFTLAGAGVSVGDTTMVLSSFKQIDGSTNITMANFGTIGFMTVEPGNGTQEEQISFTGVTQNSNGTATLSGVKTVGFVSPYTQTSGFARTHAGGVQVVISNTAGFYDKLTSKTDDETISGIWTFTAPNYPQIDTPATLPTADGQFATKKYVDGVAVAGAPNATTGVKGIIQLATKTQLAAGTSLGSTGASLVPPNSVFNSASSGTTIAVVTDGNGKISGGFGGSASTIATLNGSSKVIQDPANATTIPTTGKIPLGSNAAATTGTTTALLNGWISTNPSFLAGGSTTIQTFVAGENIDASAAPKAVYLKASDGRAYKLDATAAGEAAFAFVGFAIVQAAVLAGSNIQVQVAGIVTGFSGLTIGGYYYGTNTAGSISTTPGTETLLVGRAITASTLLIGRGTRNANGVHSFNSTTSVTITTGFKVSRVRVHALWGTAAAWSEGGWTVNGTNSCIYRDNGSTAVNEKTNRAWFVVNGGTTQQEGLINNVTATSFDLANTLTTASTIELFWEASD